MTHRLLLTLLFTIGGLIASLGTAAAQTATPTDTPTPTVAATSTSTPTVGATVTATPTATASPTGTLIPAVLPDLTITKVESTDFVLTGDLLTYTITVTNSIASGPTSNATTMTDEIPAGTALVNLSGLGCTTFGNVVSCAVPPLAPGQSQVYTIVVEVTGFSGTTITNLARVDEPTNLVVELNEANNSAAAFTPIVGPGPTNTPVPPAPTVVPPPEPVPPAPTVVPPPTGTVWARILSPMQTYSTTDDPLWIAQPGELYWVMRQEGGWILGVWEGDTRAWAVWFRADGVDLLTLDRVPPPEAGQLWLVIFQPVQTYSLTMTPLWVAMPGEWYQVLLREGGWVLGRWEGDPPELAVWMPEGPQMEFATFDLPH